MKGWKGIFAISASLMVSSIVQAVPITLDQNGIVWHWTSADIGGSQGKITLFADMNNSSLSGAYLHSFLLKKGDDADAFSVAAASVVDPEPGSKNSWTWLNGELDASDCKSNGSSSSMCFDGGSPLTFSSNTNLQFLIDFTFSKGVLPEVLHLKALWVSTPQMVCTKQNKNSPEKCEYTKVGSLLSQDFQVSPNAPPVIPGPTLTFLPTLIPLADPGTSAVPVPGTLGLLGIGLLGARLARGHKRRNS